MTAADPGAWGQERAAASAAAPHLSKRDAATRERNLNRAQARANAELAREAFAETLNELEDKLNVPKQVGIKTERFRAKARAFADEHPTAVVVIGAAAAAVVGFGVWMLVRRAADD
ncbi:DUF3618 domain-containing protein [Agromyces archimandritae]|uniref:DUF3618 domain-containing protein n=1 Tax=Agromyces archimandritae TaxID=2781962 RepID=A0A975IME9_9MICO|nr:DUF3618 domain-containing protein [Agromyces archimandritae]QTX03442.1 DUF3618 domain-containing protein [Agromyces archimandritae]